LNPLAALFVGHPVVVLIDLLLAAAPSSGQPSMLSTTEQPGPGFTWLVRKVRVLARRVLAIPATSAAPERLFSTAGNVMSKKRSRLTCDNMEELVFLHEMWPQVREWETVKKMCLE